MRSQTQAKCVVPILLVLTAIIIGSAKDARAQLIGSGFLDGKLYDLNPSTGAATNPRNLGIGWTLAFSPNGVLYGVTQNGGTPVGNALYTVNPVNGMATMIAPISVVGAPMLGIAVEGDIAFDPTSGVLYAVDGIGYLYTVNTVNGVMTLIGTGPVAGAQDFSAMAFDASGNLYIVDSGAGKLLGINKSTAAVISSVNLFGGSGGGVAGLSFDPCSGVAYLAYGTGSVDNLHTLNIITGVRTVVGPLSGTADGVGNLARSAASDLYMKDTMTPDLPEDFGAEPTGSQTLFISRDIWVRTTADPATGSTNPGPDTALPSDSFYTNEHQHQNPTYVNSTTSSYVYVKVRNRGCTSSVGTEKLRVYWANASTALPWPNTTIWNEFDCVAGGGVDPCSLPVIGPGQDYVVELPWVPPNPANYGGSDHFCIVARIETTPSPPFGMTYDESLNQWLWQNVAGNNDIVWKNVTVFTSGGGKGKLIVRNPLRRKAVMALRFAVPRGELKDNFLLHGDIFVKLDRALLRKWREGGQPPRGFVMHDETTIKITDPAEAGLDGLLFNANEERTIEVRLQFKPGNKARPGTSFNWDVTQMLLPSSARSSAIGGERYILTVPRNEK